MKLEDQVCKISQAKKLKQLGIKQESLFYWKENNIQTVVTESKMKRWIEKYLPTMNRYYSAFTIVELGAMIPKIIKKDGMRYRFRANRESNGLWHLKIRTLSPEGKAIPLCTTQNLNEAAARADMLIKLLEKEFITPQWVNDLQK